MTSDAKPVAPSATLARVRVGIREDLEVSRHIFRKHVSYIVRDPMTFQSQRLDEDDYSILVAISAERTLGQTFQALVEEKRILPEDEDAFYQFVLSLHGLGFLRLPLADHSLLFRRYQAKRRAQRRARIMGFLFLRIPLWNPHAFLQRTKHLVS